MLTIELDYKNSKEKLIKSFNKKIPGKKFFPGIYTWRVFQNLISLYCQEGSISIKNDYIPNSFLIASILASAAALAAS